jgi:hypothetical protein
VAHKAIFDSGTIGTGEAWRYVARKKGTYNYPRWAFALENRDFFRVSGMAGAFSNAL